MALFIRGRKNFFFDFLRFLWFFADFFFKRYIKKYSIRSMSKSHESQNEGNTIPRSVVRFRRICFTLNNYSETEYLESQKLSDLMIIGKEVGEHGTPHLQGYCEFKNQKTLEQIKKYIPRAHIEKAKGKRDENIVYCSKGQNFINTFPEEFFFKINRIMMSKMPIMDRPWQLKIMEDIEKEPDDRTINWIWRDEGKVGKSKFVKYLCIKYKAQLVPTRTADALHHIAKLMTDKIIPEIILVDVPRCSMEFINYQALEMIKNGSFSSGKYEGGMCIFPNPHVYVFANEPPNIDMMSKDRWNIVELE